MPEAVYGLPQPRAEVVYATSALYAGPIPAINTEYPIPDLVRRTAGPTGWGILDLWASQNANGCAKFVTVTIYANGIAVAASTSQFASDSSAGNTNEFILTLPPQIGPTLWRATWKTTCPAGGNGTLYSASRSMQVPLA